MQNAVPQLPPEPTPVSAAPSVQPRQTGRRVLVNTGALTSASLWRIVMSFVLQMMIARRLGVDGLGHYTVAMAYLNVSQVISELGLPTLLVRDLAQNPSHRRSYFRILLGTQIVTGLLTWAGLVGLTLVLPYPPVTAMSLWLVGASLPLFAVTSVSETLFQAGERMELVMGVEVFINTLILALSIGMLWMGGDEVTLIGVVVVTQAVSALTCLVLLARSQLLAAPQDTVPVSLPRLVRQTIPFFGLAMSDVLLQRLDILLLSFVAGPTITGIYSAAYNVVRVLMKLVQSFWRALYPTLSRLHRQSQSHYDRLAALSLRFGLVLLLPAAALSMAVASELLRLLFGGSYAESAEVYRILIWAAPLFLMEIYAVTLLMIEHHLRPSLWISALHIAGIVALLPPLTNVFGADGTAWAVVLGGALGALLSLWLLYTLHVPLRVKRFWGMALATVVAGLLAYLLPLPWLATLVLGGSVYLTLCWATGVLSTADIQTLRRILLNSRVN
ncbi:MAG: flippase [Caldilineaceae bacterium]|nr:flippase [Caldilineaceae bacterium]